MKVVYPSLVEQQHKYMLSRGYEVDKADLYKYMVENNIIDENGTPTQSAIDNNLVGFKSSVERIHDFKDDYPMFKDLDDSHFRVLNDGTVTIDMYGLKQIANKVLDDSNSTVEQVETARQWLAACNGLQ